MGNQFLSQPPLLSTCTICQLERFTLHRWKTVLLVLFIPRRCRAVCSRVCESGSGKKRMPDYQGLSERKTICDNRWKTDSEKRQVYDIMRGSLLSIYKVTIS